MKRLALYTFIDAFGWEIYKHYGFLEGYLREAKELKTTFGFSSAADPSILTGRYPDEHTHWSSFYYAPEISPFKLMRLFALLPGFIFDRWRIRHWLSRLLKAYYGYTGYFELYSVPFKYLPYFDYLEKYDYFLPGGILRTDTIFDYCAEHKIPYHCSNWRLSEEENLKIMKERLAEGKIRFAYLYLPKLDGVMHTFGTRHLEVEKKLHWLEREVSQVIKEAERHYDEVSFYLLSDHGMKDVKGSLDLIKIIKATHLKFGHDYVAMYDSTMARFWFLNEKSRMIIEERLKGVEEGYIVTDDELKRMHVFFPDRRFGELFFLMNPGLLINPSFMGLKVIPGMHGYHPDDRDSSAMLASNRQIPPEIKVITDIRKTMENELKL